MRQKAVNKNVKYSYDKKNTTEYSFGSKFQNFCHKNCCIAQGVGKNYVHVCFVVVYQDSTTSPDAIVDYVLMIVFSYYVQDLLVFSSPFYQFTNQTSQTLVFLNIVHRQLFP